LVVLWVIKIAVIRVAVRLEFIRVERLGAARTKAVIKTRRPATAVLANALIHQPSP